MTVLNRKLMRDIRGSAGTLATIMAIIAVGTGSFIGFGSAHRILTASQSAYYREYRFADFWVDVKKMPLTEVDRIARLDGVASLEPRISFDVILDVPGVVRPLVGRLLSAPERGFERTINGICLVRGSGFSSDRDEEVILSEEFAQAHGLNPGDRVQVILNRKRQEFVIVGTAISPEYVYMVQGVGDLMPDPEHFSVLYLKEDYARDVLDFQDACNQVVGRMVPGALDDVEILLDKIDRMLEPYGVFATTPRRRQASNRFLSDEIEGLGKTAAIMPTIFLLVAALVLNIVMTRFAERQRTIVGTLKAMGYTNRAILLHFLGFGIVVGIGGGIAGDALGVLVTEGMVVLYKGFFQFPRYVQDFYPDLMLLGVLISIAFAVGGVVKGALTALRLEPAEAMRQKPPALGGAILLERITFLWRRFGFRTHIALRSLFRNPIRSTTGVVCSALATSIVLVSLMMWDSMKFLVVHQFERVLHSDVDIGMRDARSMTALYEARSLPGVDYTEPALGVTVDLRHGRRSRRMSIMGLPDGHRLLTPIATDGSRIEIPPEGLVMTNSLSDILGMRIGDSVDVTPVRGRRRTRQAWLAATVDSYFGVACYADQRYLSGLVGEAAAVNSVQCLVNPAHRQDLFRAIKDIPNAQWLSVRADAKANIESTFVESMLSMVGIMVVFAGVVSFGSMLNQSLVEMSDRIREISTFRVLGYHPGQVASIFLRQNMIIFLVGLVGSLPLAYGMMSAIATAYDAELFRMPVIIHTDTVLYTGVIALVFVLIVQVFVYRHIRGLDWLEGVQIKE